MTATAFALVLTAAVVHATWNLLAKRLSGYDTFAYLWLTGVCATLLYGVPAIAVIIVVRPHIGLVEIGFVLGSGLIQCGYCWLLQSAYRSGDMSLVYPLSRGTGPMLASAAAIAFFGERPSPVALAGVVLVGLGVFVLGMPSGREAARPSLAAIVFALSTGVTIAGYTLWDSYAVSELAVPPLPYQWGVEVALTALAMPAVITARRRSEVRKLWRERWRYVLIAGALMPLAYLLVLLALVFSPVSAIAPAREVSVLIGVILGGRLLAEGHLRRRLPPAAAIAGGVIAIALG